MEPLFEIYKPRQIEFQELNSINDWNVKVYSITNNKKFQSYQILKNSIKEVPRWLQKVEKTKIPVYKMAFLIVHEAREGVWLLFNWWTGGEMIATEVYFSNYNEPFSIKKSPYNTSSLLCVWELEIFSHERKLWIEHVLLHPNNPKFKDYLNKNYNS